MSTNLITGLSRDVLRFIAQKPQFEEACQHLLRQAVHLVHARAGVYVVFENPYHVARYGLQEDELPSDEDCLALAESLSPEVHVTNRVIAPLNHWATMGIVMPLKTRQRVIGLLQLFFEEAADMTDENANALLAVMDGLAIITDMAQVSARHQTLMNNQNEFVRIVSHDLRSPLTSIQGFASMMGAAGNLSEKQAHFVEKILSGVSQMTSLVDNIQDAGRYDPETGFYEMELALTDVVDIINRIVRNHILPAEKSELTLVVRADDNIPIIPADGNMLERALLNLVDNAIKYTPNGGRIEVSAEVEQGHLRIAVKDNGLGISLENMRQLFQRHFRIRRPEHKKVKGSGLGLFIVRSVARQHGGDAFVESIEGQGSLFGITIPLDQNHE